MPAGGNCSVCELPDAVTQEITAKYQADWGAVRLVKWLHDEGYGYLTQAMVANHLTRGHEGKRDGTARPQVRHNLGKIADLLARSGIDPDEIGKVKSVTLSNAEWQVATKNDDGEAEIHDLKGGRESIVLSPEWSEGPKWPVVQPVEPAVIKYRSLKPKTASPKVTVLLPDPQIGFRRYGDGTLEAMHDRRAMDCALELISVIRPHRIVNLGDYLDFAEWSSKFAVLPEFVLTTQPALDEGHRFLAEQRAAAGPELDEQDLLEGNHDDRLAQSVMRNAKAALRLRRADQPEGWPVLSLQNLVALDTLGVTYHGGYPAGKVKLASSHGRQAPMVALHGKKTDMRQQARSERQSTVQGHAHHFSMHAETYEVDGLAIEVEAWSLGCLCRTDGAVPSTLGGNDARGQAIIAHESWQQGIGVLAETEDGWDLQPLRIRDGRAFWQGREITAAP